MDAAAATGESGPRVAAGWFCGSVPAGLSGWLSGFSTPCFRSGAAHTLQAFDAARRGRGRKVVITCPRAVHRLGPMPPVNPEWDDEDEVTTDGEDFWDGDPYHDDVYNDPYDEGYFSDDYPPIY